MLTFSATSDSIGWNLPARFPGVRLPRLAAALRETDAAIEEWSEEPAVVRALVAPDEDEIGPALERCNRWPDFDQRVAELQGAHGRAHEVALRLVAGFEPTRGREPHRTMIRRSEHLAQMAMHTDGYFGYRQWFFFDDVWAAAHPALAASLMHYGVHWDPRCPCDHETFDCVP
ncbi:hypothetical protein [Thermocatellispora tengchongensis]|uniref:hypothetical protein n=1 Tax=Thermocatellispora tengchongensis TaxID=1073253 RepID=UPI00363B3BF8